MLSAWSGPAETLTQSDQAQGCSGQQGGIQGGFLQTQRSCTGMSRRDTPGAAAGDPLLAAAPELFAGSLSCCLELLIPHERKGPGTASSVAK